tara:strand:- start:182309 stop:182632 length:324 start_codon:yes stop_codon:yes gene_type:complete
MKFFCTIHEPIKGGYKILLNKKNINFLPGTDTTLRRIFINTDLKIGQIIYVSESELGSGGKLLVKVAHSVSNIDFTAAPIVQAMDAEIKSMISSKDKRPVDIFTHVQ